VPGAEHHAAHLPAVVVLRHAHSSPSWRITSATGSGASADGPQVVVG
jgi:hypothetical protein